MHMTVAAQASMILTLPDKHINLHVSANTGFYEPISSTRCLSSHVREICHLKQLV